MLNILYIRPTDWYKNKPKEYRNSHLILVLISFFFLYTFHRQKKVCLSCWKSPWDSQSRASVWIRTTGSRLCCVLRNFWRETFMNKEPWWWRERDDQVLETDLSPECHRIWHRMNNSSWIWWHLQGRCWLHQCFHYKSGCFIGHLKVFCRENKSVTLNCTYHVRVYSFFVFGYETERHHWSADVSSHCTVANSHEWF